MEAIIEGKQKRAVCVWHRRAGKDKTFINILSTMMAQRRGAYHYYFPTAVMGRKIFWEGMDKEGLPFKSHFPAGFITKENNQEMKLETVNGSILRIIGTDRLDVVGTNPVGCVFSETSLQNPAAWNYVRPILAENGGWAIFNGTPRGKNWFYKLYRMALDNDKWFCERLSADITKAISEEAIEDERQGGMPEHMVQQEFYCDFEGGAMGAIYAKELDKLRERKRITSLTIDNNYPVYTFWDLGAPLNTAIWYVQIIGREIIVLDHDSGQPFTTGERVAHINSKDYHYAGHVMPHDAGQTQKGGMSFAVEMEKAGLKGIRILPVTRDVNVGINSLRGMMPHMWFDKDNCKDGLEALEAYHLLYDEKKEMFLDNPCHDWSSHSADALRYLAEAASHGYIKAPNSRKKKPNVTKSGSEKMKKPRVKHY